MRIWDIPPSKLCKDHILGEHRELHAIWSILTNNKKGYSHHPETLRWKGKLKALYLRHEKLVQDMEKRSYNHKSPLDKRLARGKMYQNLLVGPIRIQVKKLKNKHCECRV